MSEVVHGATPSPNPPVLERLTRIASRFLLPATALTSLFLGLALLVDPLGAVGDYIPLALFAIGLGAAASSIAAQSWSHPGRSPESPVATVRVVGAAARRNPATTGGAPAATDRPRAFIADSGSEWRVLSAPAGPGDETWLSWLPREHRRLGSAAGEFTPGVVRSPGKAGNLVAFPVRNYYLGVRSSIGAGGPTDTAPVMERGAHAAEIDDLSVAAPDDRGGEPVPPSPTAHPLSQEELDRLFPPDSVRGPIFLSEAPERVGGPASWAGSPRPSTDRVERSDGAAPSRETPMLLPPAQGELLSWEVPTDEERVAHLAPRGSGTSLRSGSLDIDPAPVSPSARLSSEATNPVPPHLRATGPHTRIEANRPMRRAPPTASQRSVCASCSKVVVNLRMSGPCPNCLRPVCSDCLREAFASRGHGWCVDCSSVPSASAERTGRSVRSGSVTFRDRGLRPTDGLTVRDVPERR